MSYFGSTDWYARIMKGEIPGHSIVHKFGAGNLTTTLSPISQSLTYQTPTAAVALEIVSSSANDALNNTGAHEYTITGLDANWNEVTQVVTAHATNGTIAVAIPTSLIRLYQWYVSKSGAYATATVGSHVGTLTVRVAGGGATCSQIVVTPFPIGQSQIGVYTIPIGYTGYLLSKNTFVDTAKSADIYFFQRPLANDVTTSFTGTMRLIQREVGIKEGYNLRTVTPKGLFVGPCDIGFMGLVSVGTAECSVEFELLLIAS